MKYYLPIFLKNTNHNNIKIDENITIKKMTPRQREEFFGIKKIDISFHPKLNKYALRRIHPANADGRYDYKENLEHHIVNNTDTEIFGANYVVEINNCKYNELDNIAENLNLTFNISMPTSTRCYLQFEHDDLRVGFFSKFERALFSLNPLKLTKKDVEDLPIIYTKIKNLKNKEKIKFNLYFDGIHSQTSTELRFLSLVMALENMFLPDSKAELSLRLSLRISKIIGNKISKKNKKQVFDLTKELYDLRSHIIHGGYSTKLKYSKQKLNEIYAQTVNLLWVSLVEYINYPEKFKKEYLDDILKI